jgi:hypothetical protein
MTSTGYAGVFLFQAFVFQFTKKLYSPAGNYEVAYGTMGMHSELDSNTSPLRAPVSRPETQNGLNYLDPGWDGEPINIKKHVEWFGLSLVRVKDHLVNSEGDLESGPSMKNPERPAQSTRTNVATYVYDGDGVMVKSIVNGVTTYYVGGYYEYEDNGSNTTERKYYSATGMRIAMRTTVNGTNDTLNWLLGDHLGSTSMTTDSNGVKETEATLPLERCATN